MRGRPGAAAEATAAAKRTLLAAATWALIVLAGLVAGYLVVGPAGHGASRGTDLSIARWLGTHRPVGAAGAAGVLPDALLLVAGIGVALLVARAVRRHRSVAPIAADVASLGLAAVGSYALVEVLKVVFARPRPPRALAAVRDTGFAFPSAHTTVGAALIVTAAIVACRHLPRRVHRSVVAASGALLVLVPLSRLALGVHWMTDVVIGSMLGIGWGLASCRLALRPLDAARRTSSVLRRRLVCAGVAVVVLLFVPVGWSYSRALSYPGSADVGTRTTDWLRSEGAGSLVDWIENFWYARTTIGPAKASEASHPFRAGVARPATRNQPRPVAVPPATAVGLRAQGRNLASAFDGKWAPVVRPGGLPTALYTTYWRPDPTQPDIVVAGMWIDRSQTHPKLVAGTKEPGGSGWPWGAEIPPQLRTQVLAAFNGGFRMKDANGGFEVDGRVAVPLRVGAASLVISRDGTARIGRWGIDVGRDPTVVGVRQNLQLIVDGGHPVPGLDQNADGAWGTSHVQLEHTWRSALGVDAHGNLVYVAGAGLNLQTLATAITQAGAVRAMELDIHDPVVTCNLYEPDPAHPGSVIARKLIPTMQRPATRYLQPDQRDFIAIVADR